MRYLLIALPLVLLATPAFAGRTAQVSGTPPMRTGPGSDYPVTGIPIPEGAVVTLEHCTADKTKPYPGMPQPRPNDGDWCLVFGGGWVDAKTLTSWSAADHAVFPSEAPAALIDGPAPIWFDQISPE